MKLIIILFILSINTNIYSQKYDYIWLGGGEGINSFILNFNYTPDSIYRDNRIMIVSEMYSIISDKNGNLLFYTKGDYIADSSGQMMQNGDGLNPGQIAQSTIFYPTDGAEIALPVPQKDSLYELFHMGLRYDPGGFGILTDKIYHTTINMNLNGGKGAVIAKNQLLLEDTLITKLSAVQHGNGIDWWILTPDYGTNGFYSFLLTSDSIYGPYYQQIGPIHSSEWFAQNTFSPDGKKYARYDGMFQLDLFDFNRCTGLLSNHIHIMPGYSNAPGLSFSTNSRYLYASTNSSIILQYDLLAPDIAASGDTVAVYDGYVDSSGQESYFYRMQLTPNGKIYINSGDASFHVIHSPDSGGLACNIEQRGLSLPTYNVSKTPNFPHFRTGALAGSPCDTLGVGVDLVEEEEKKVWVYPNPTDNILRVEWNKANFDKGELVLLDALGRVVYQEKISNNMQMIEVSTSHLATGVYFCKVQFTSYVGNVPLDKVIYTEKIVVKQN